MQLIAKDQNDQLIYVREAKKRHNYYCLECSSLLHKRSGENTQEHFYHLTSNINCRQHAKSIEHLQTQLYIYKQYGGRATLEKRFEEINRIADVAIEDLPLIFEIQCSPISKKEVEARIQDYASLGLNVVWIFHEKHFNRSRLTLAEKSLQYRTYFYTNIDAKGRGFIHDKLQSVHINTSHITPMLSKRTPKLICRRKRFLPYYFEGDLTDCFLQGTFITPTKRTNPLLTWVKALFHFALEHACR